MGTASGGDQKFQEFMTHLNVLVPTQFSSSFGNQICLMHWQWKLLKTMRYWKISQHWPSITFRVSLSRRASWHSSWVSSVINAFFVYIQRCKLPCFLNTTFKIHPAAFIFIDTFIRTDTAIRATADCQFTFLYVGNVTLTNFSCSVIL